MGSDIPRQQRSNIFSIFYAGLLNKNRPIDKVIRAVKTIEDVELIVAGYDDRVKEIEKWANEEPCGKPQGSNSHITNTAAATLWQATGNHQVEEPRKIQFIGKIAYSHVLKRTLSADLLFSFYEPAIPVAKFASPNKLFEAMMDGKHIFGE